MLERGGYTPHGRHAMRQRRRRNKSEGRALRRVYTCRARALSMPARRAPRAVFRSACRCAHVLRCVERSLSLTRSVRPPARAYALLLSPSLILSLSFFINIYVCYSACTFVSSSRGVPVARPARACVCTECKIIAGAYRRGSETASGVYIGAIVRYGVARWFSVGGARASSPHAILARAKHRSAATVGDVHRRTARQHTRGIGRAVATGAAGAGGERGGYQRGGYDGALNEAQQEQAEETLQEAPGAGGWGRREEAEGRQRAAGERDAHRRDQGAEGPVDEDPREAPLERAHDAALGGDRQSSRHYAGSHTTAMEEFERSLQAGAEEDYDGRDRATVDLALLQENALHEEPDVRLVAPEKWRGPSRDSERRRGGHKQPVERAGGPQAGGRLRHDGRLRARRRVQRDGKVRAAHAAHLARNAGRRPGGGGGGGRRAAGGGPGGATAGAGGTLPDPVAARPGGSQRPAAAGRPLGNDDAAAAARDYLGHTDDDDDSRHGRPGDRDDDRELPHRRDAAARRPLGQALGDPAAGLRPAALGQAVGDAAGPAAARDERRARRDERQAHGPAAAAGPDQQSALGAPEDSRDVGHQADRRHIGPARAGPDDGHAAASRDAAEERRRAQRGGQLDRRLAHHRGRQGRYLGRLSLLHEPYAARPTLHLAAKAQGEESDTADHHRGVVEYTVRSAGQLLRVDCEGVNVGQMNVSMNAIF